MKVREEIEQYKINCFMFDLKNNLRNGIKQKTIDNTKILNFFPQQIMGHHLFQGQTYKRQKNLT